MKTGVIITVHNRWEAGKECIESVLKHLQGERLILVYDNQSDEEEIKEFPKIFPEIVFIRINDQTQNGGLTGTWNQGAWICLEKGCDVVIFLNHDTVVDSTINNLPKAVRESNFYGIFGPFTDNGPFCPLQVSDGPEEGLIIFENPFHINGFCFALSKKTLGFNRYDEAHFFDPSKPFNGNEDEFNFRLFQNGGKGVIVKSAYVKHKKFSDWRKNKNRDQLVFISFNKHYRKYMKGLESIYFWGYTPLLATYQNDPISNAWIMKDRNGNFLDCTLIGTREECTGWCGHDNGFYFIDHPSVAKYDKKTPLLFLDGDAVIQHEIDSLFELDFSNNKIYVVHNFGGPGKVGDEWIANNPTIGLEEFCINNDLRTDLSEKEQYNSGVFIASIETHLKILEFFERKLKQTSVSALKRQTRDQIIHTLICYTLCEVIFLDKRYNATPHSPMTASIIKEAFIVHNYGF